MWVCVHLRLWLEAPSVDSFIRDRLAFVSTPAVRNPALRDLVLRLGKSEETQQAEVSFSALC